VSSFIALSNTYIFTFRPLPNQNESWFCVVVSCNYDDYDDNDVVDNGDSDDDDDDDDDDDYYYYYVVSNNKSGYWTANFWHILLFLSYLGKSMLFKVRYVQFKLTPLSTEVTKRQNKFRTHAQVNKLF